MPDVMFDRATPGPELDGGSAISAWLHTVGDGPRPGLTVGVMARDPSATPGLGLAERVEYDGIPLTLAVQVEFTATGGLGHVCVQKWVLATAPVGEHLVEVEWGGAVQRGGTVSASWFNVNPEVPFAAPDTAQAEGSTTALVIGPVPVGAVAVDCIYSMAYGSAPGASGQIERAMQLYGVGGFADHGALSSIGPMLEAADDVEFVWEHAAGESAYWAAVGIVLLPASDASTVTATLGLQWQVREAVVAATELPWRVRQAVEAVAAEFQWQVRQAIQAELQLPWQVRAAIATALQASWAVQQVVAASTEAQWQVRQLVQADSALVWSVLTNVAGEIALPWSVRQRLAVDADLQWQVLQQLFATVDLRWQALAQVAGSVELQWRVGEALAQVSATLGLEWQVLAPVVRSLDLQWSTLAEVRHQLGLRWQVLERVAAQVSTSWAVRQRLQAGATLNWQVIGRTGATVQLRWRIEAEGGLPELVGDITIKSRTPVIGLASRTPIITIH